MYLLSTVRFYSGRYTVTCANSKRISAAPSAPLYKYLLEPQRNVLVNISHSSCTCNGDHIGLLIKTGSIQKERMMTQTTIRNL